MKVEYCLHSALGVLPLYSLKVKRDMLNILINVQIILKKNDFIIVEFGDGSEFDANLSV